MKDYPTCKTCKFLLPVHCHPGNNEIGKGRMSKLLGYACTFFADSQLDGDNNKLVFKEDDNGTCECHTVGNKVAIDDWS